MRWPWTHSIEKEDDTLARSKNRTITVHKGRHTGVVPLFVELGHRHLEKAGAVGHKDFDNMSFTIPVDFVRSIASLPKELTDEITEIELHYDLIKQH